MKNRIVTTKQKKFIERTCIALGIDIDEMLEINELSSIKKSQKDLFDIILVQGQTINELKKEMNELQDSLRKITQAKIDEMWNLFIGNSEDSESETNE